MNIKVRWNIFTAIAPVIIGAVKLVLNVNWNACLFEVAAAFKISMWATPVLPRFGCQTVPRLKSNNAVAACTSYVAVNTFVLSKTFT